MQLWVLIPDSLQIDPAVARQYFRLYLLNGRRLQAAVFAKVHHGRYGMSVGLWQLPSARTENGIDLARLFFVRQDWLKIALKAKATTKRGPLSCEFNLILVYTSSH